VELGPNCVMPTLGFDETDTFLYYGTPVGIKIYNVKSSEFVKVLGKVESTERFIHIALYQGKPQKSAI
jgi:peptidylprolyl isomerase domain and WD repeat-containing protein 1